MFFYMDPYGDEAAYPRLMTHRDEETRTTTRLMFDRGEKNVVLFQEQYVIGRMVSNRIAMSPETASQMFSQHAAQIAEFSK